MIHTIAAWVYHLSEFNPDRETLAHYTERLDRQATAFQTMGQALSQDLLGVVKTKARYEQQMYDDGLAAADEQRGAPWTPLPFVERG